MDIFSKRIAAKRCLLIPCMILLAIAVAGCATAPKWSESPVSSTAVATGDATPADANAPATPATSAISMPDTQVVLQPYDTIRVKFLYWPELDDEQMIRPDGKISLLMVGEIEAQNRTPDQLQEELVALYKDKINNPEINVVTTSLANNRIYVGGEVGTPGLILIQGKLTALGAIMQAGGFLEPTAKKSTVVVVRQKDGKQHARTIDLKAVLEHPETDSFYLQPYDIVWVPRTEITHLNQFVAQYIDGVIPKHLNFSVGLYRQGVTKSSAPAVKPITPVSVSVAP